MDTSDRSEDDEPHRDQPGEVLYRRSFDPTTDSISEACIDAVATLDDADPLELTALASAIDPDALDTLFEPWEDGAPRNSNGRVIFDYTGYTIDVESTGTITIHSQGP